MARRNAASDQAPMPVSGSGVMLLEKIVPKGVGSARPPAKGRPDRVMWQSLQLPMADNSAPTWTVRRSAFGIPPGEMGSIAGRQVQAKPIPTAMNTATTIACRIRRRYIMFTPQQIGGSVHGFCNAVLSQPFENG